MTGISAVTKNPDACEFFFLGEAQAAVCQQVFLDHILGCLVLNWALNLPVMHFCIKT